MKAEPAPKPRDVEDQHLSAFLGSLQNEYVTGQGPNCGTFFSKVRLSKSAERALGE
jgi:hypothetical protein